MVAFPLQDRYELLLDGTWTDISSWVYERDPVTITRGVSSEADSADPCKMTLTLNNRDGRFSTRNPVSPYYGLIGRNTQIRASVPGDTYFEQGPAKADNVTAPDATGLDVTGDIDVRIDVTPTSIGTLSDIVGKWDNATQKSWALTIDSLRKVTLYWSTDGSANSSATSTAALPASDRRIALRATLDVDNGSSGNTVTFYTADTISGAWTQLGDAVTASGTTSVFSGTAPVEVGCVANGGGSLPTILVHAFELRSGIGGTVVADPDFTAQTAGGTSFTDTAGNTWTVNGDGALSDRLWRFHGEVATWPTTWSMNSVDHYVKLTAAGIKRRLTQNAPNIRSPMTREFSNPARQSIVAYWPMEDGAEATQVAAAGSSAPAARIVGSPTFADYSGWTASDPLPTMASGAIIGTVPDYTPTGEISVRLFVFMPSGGVTTDTSLLHVRTSGTAAAWEIRLNAAGNLTTKAWDDNGVPIDDGAGNLDTEFAFDMDSLGFTIVNLELSQDGSDVDWRMLVIDFVNTATISDTIPITGIVSGTVTGKTVGAARTVAVGRDRGLTGVKVGHLAVASDLGAYAATAAAIAAHNGENPTDRMDRLCTEEEITFTAVGMGAIGNTVTLGDQLNKALVELLEEAAETDGGILYEPRDAAGFTYRSRLGMYNQAAAVTLDYSAGQIDGDLIPVDDDRDTVNDLTVKREAGSSIHVEETTGPLSTAEPPDGVGRYAGEVTLSLESDSELADQAGWRLHLGTVDEARFPELTVNLRGTGITGDLAAQVLDLDVGDRIVLTGIPEGLPPDDVSLFVLGYTETLRLYSYEITFNLAPESPWHVGVVESAGFDRIDTDGSTLDADATSTATSLSVTSADAPWTTATDDLPFGIFVAGERMTVTAVSGTSSPQTFTVTRAVNGVEKAHDAGAAVTIAEPIYVPL